MHVHVPVPVPMHVHVHVSVPVHAHAHAHVHVLILPYSVPPAPKGSIHRVLTLTCQASAFNSVARRFINDLDSLMVHLVSQPQP